MNMINFYLLPTGRINRFDFLFKGVSILCLLLWFYFYGLASDSLDMRISFIVVAILFWIGFMVFVKRFHDMGWSAWFFVFIYMPLMSIIFFPVYYLLMDKYPADENLRNVALALGFTLYPIFKEGEKKANKFGPRII